MVARKFRGKDIEDGIWRYGWLIVDGKEHFILNEIIEANEQYITIGDWRKVDPETVGQFTGTLDVAWNKIFEGDVLADIENRHSLYKVEYVDLDGRFQLSGFDSFDLEDTENLEIIGNIHDDPGLIELYD